MANESPNGWQEWSRHVLAELERLDTSIKEVDCTVRRMEKDITSLRVELSIKSGVWGLIGGAITAGVMLLIRIVSK